MIVTSVKSLGHSPFSCTLLISFVIILRPSSPNILGTSPGTSPSPVAFFALHLLDSFSNSVANWQLAIDMARAITPSSLFGIDRRIAYANRKYHSG